MINKILGAMILLLATQAVSAFDSVPRRRDQFGQDFSYFIYPVGGEIPGLGKAAGVGASILNINDTDADFTGFSLKGDFEASGYTLLDMHIIPRTLVFDIGYYDFLVSPIQYRRGLDSDNSDYILPKVKGAYYLSQLTLTKQQRQLEAYLRYGGGTTQLLQVLDKDGKKFDAIDSSENRVGFATLGAIADFTDDRLDPRRGLRFEAAANFPRSTSEVQSDYYVTDFNFTGYQPFFNRDTLSYNMFYSGAHVYNQASTDYNELKQKAGLGCEQYPPGPRQNDCYAAEKSYIEGLIQSNRYGNASSLGGTQRLRSFANGRYYAGQTLFYGLEYRMNISRAHTPFNYYIAKGVKTGMQMSLFWEQGSVADHTRDLVKDHRTSYGVGFRLVLSGVIVRADFARGNEGNEFVLFFNYPWSMFSVDNPG